MRNKYLYITLLAVLGITPEMLTAQTLKVKEVPQLVVSITIDQLRSDYLELFAPLYGEDGFKRLLQQGMVFNNAHYPFTPIDRASASASLTTGVTPYYHSIVGEYWLDRETLRTVYCVDENDAPASLSTSTIGDELKVSTDGKAMVYSISPYRDAAVLTAGHAADAAIWIDNQTGLWMASKYCSKTVPTWVVIVNELKAPALDKSKIVWQPLNTKPGIVNFLWHKDGQKPFMHQFTGSKQFHQLKASGLVNSYVTDAVDRCCQETKIGQDKITDLLAVNYYAGPYDHRVMSDCQLELQDTYVRLDHEIARLINGIEQSIGRDKVLFVVTSTGCNDTEEADYSKFRIPTGTFNITRTANLMNMYFGAIWGQGRYVESCFGNQMFLNHKLLESKRISITEACQRAQEFISQLSGVRNVYSGLQLLTNINTQTEKNRNGYNPSRCGDIIIEVTAGWKIYNEDNKETQLSQVSHIEFPIIFYGADIKTEQISNRVTIDRIAPTIAKSIRIRAPNACASEPLF
jgi:hypothetical protein